jgi:hypothetical protein
VLNAVYPALLPDDEILVELQIGVSGFDFACRLDNHGLTLVLIGNNEY